MGSFDGWVTPIAFLMRGPLDSAIDLIDIGRSFGDDLEIDHGNIGRRHANSDAVEPAFELGQNEADGLGRARRGRDHGEGRRARAVKVLVKCVECRLVSRIGVNRGHESLVDADGVIDHLGYWRQAVGGTGRIGYDDVLTAELVVVDPIDDSQVGILARRRDENTLGAGFEMGRCLLLGGEEARALKGNVDAQLLPWKSSGIFDSGDFDAPVIDDNRVTVDLHRMGKAAVN